MKLQKLLVILLLFFSLGIYAQDLKTKNVVFVTIDGLRWQEVFGGVDTSIMNTKSQADDKEFIQKKYLFPDYKKRRETLMPFLWGEIAQKGTIIGNRNSNCTMDVTNKYWFSYPGYSELFCGWADDSINSNDKKYNRNITIFDAVQSDKRYNGKVAAFASWDCFPYIINQPRSGIYVNAGNIPVSGKSNCTEQAINDIVQNMAIFTDGIRYDIFTYYYAFEYLKAQKPRFLFIGFDETDDWAHMASYVRYLDAAQQSDRVIRLLWQWIQSDEQYKNCTTLIVSCDHGRGTFENDNWRHHDVNRPGSEETWMAIIGPDTPAKGENITGNFYANQIAQTITHLLGVNFGSPKVGKHIEQVINHK